MITHTGKAGYNNVYQLENSGGSLKHSRPKVLVHGSHEQSSGTSYSQINGKREVSCYYDNYLWFGPKGIDGEYLQSLLVAIFLSRAFFPTHVTRNFLFLFFIL